MLNEVKHLGNEGNQRLFFCSEAVKELHSGR
jgi:hypothetical protein